MKIKFLSIIFIGVWFILLVRVFFLAVNSNSYYEQLSYNNSVKVEQIAPVRGEIVDRNNQPLAINELGFKIQLAPQLDEKLESEVDYLIKMIPTLEKAKIIKEYKKFDSYYNHSFIDVVPFVAYDSVLPVYSLLNLRESIRLFPSPKRFYPHFQAAAHLIGYVSRTSKKDIENDKTGELIGYTGKAGIEKQYNTYLQGVVGKREIKVNASNEEIEELSSSSPIEDRRLMLNIDIELQNFIASFFTDKAGAVVIMDVNGSVLAAGSYPEYDLNTFVSGISHDVWNQLSRSIENPFTNKLINGLYPPGSTIKTGLGLLYITSPRLGEDFGVNCTAQFPLGRRVFRCWKKGGHGGVGIKRAVKSSCDDFFYKGSVQLGIKNLSDGLMRYGLGVKTGVDLPNEFVGIVPSREWKLKKYKQPWYMGETVNTAIGQGSFLSTPLQIARYTALMATGKLPKPHIAKMIGNQPVMPEFSDILTPLEKKKLPIIQEAMYAVCNEEGGTAKQFIRSRVTIAGKTGTAQVVGILQNIKDRQLEHDMEYYTRSHAWFTSYGPYENPQVIVLVLVEHGGHGGDATGGIVSAIYDKLLNMGYITNP